MESMDGIGLCTSLLFRMSSFSRSFSSQVISFFFLAEEIWGPKKPEQIHQYFFEGSFIEFSCTRGLAWTAAQKDPFVQV